MSKSHNPRFIELVASAKRKIKETTVAMIHDRLKRGPLDEFLLIDVREDHEWQEGRLPGALHLGKGILERDIETIAPDLAQEIVLYCGGGFRSALAADALQQLGYTNVHSMAGGVRAWKNAHLPIENQ